MLHRAKYNRFRNESVTSVDELLHGLSMNYLGCIEVLRSMRSLDFTTRSQITREAISLVCEAVPGAKGALRKRKPPSKLLSSILGKSNLQFAGMSINLNISTSSLNLMTPDSKQIIANHHMQSISFASGGDPDTTDYVAYVAKDPVNRRACHILECSDGLAQDVISTIGQAFDLRFQLYLQCPSSKPSSMHDRAMSTDEPQWMEEGEESADHHYYNSIPGKMPPAGGFIDSRLTNQIQDSSQAAGVDQTYYQGRPMFIQQGSCDIYSLPEVKGQVPKAGEVPTYVNTQHIDTQVLAAGTAKDSPRKDLFDMSKSLEKFLKGQHLFEIEIICNIINDFTVTFSQFNASLLNKNHIFESISHLIGHHRDNNLPIVSAGSELCLKQPMERKQ
uniref:SHC-transforming protein 3-like n=1 Tax=Sinocyclocheilus anshuiensis TaxID=1608454 RepID=A0A671PNY6_9TELE